MRRLVIHATWLAALFLAAGFSTANFAEDRQATAEIAEAPARPTANTAKAAEFQDAMRKLWEDHIVFTRCYIISVAHALPDKDATAKRLLQNQTDIGNAIKPFYGDEAGAELERLLKEHITIAVELLDAAKAGNKSAVDTANRKWGANGDAIAIFLNKANPKSWPLEAMKAEMKMHLEVTLREANNRIGGKYADDINDYEHVHEHILKLADTLSSGIIAQFPDKFQ
ncbi:MAG: hypothetical protein IT462_01460 [Planctomycetes bacterium]|nr:hypothetical protein [Planctomycetota bacterium]